MLSVAFEGGEGSGKSTTIKMLAAYLEKQGYTVTCIREPGTTEVGEEIRSVIFNHGKLAPETEAMLFAASRAELMDKIIFPYIEKSSPKDILIIDRFVYSSYVYNGYINDIMDGVIGINNFATKNWKPDICFLMDIEPKAGLQRVFDNSKDREVNRLDMKDLSFHESIRKGYLSILGVCKEIKVIDASKEADDRLSDCIKILTDNGLLKKGE
jgi:dTMP kinase